MKALVTGADGFVGRWLTEHLEASGDEVWRATGADAGNGPRTRAVELTDAASVADMVSWARPEAIYHLAAVAFGPDATTGIGHAIDVTVRGTAFVLDAAAREADPPRVLIPSSSEVYGAVSAGPVTESHPVAPVNLYGATKAAQEAIGLAFHRSERVRVCVARAFNHIGPGQRTSFVVPSFAAQLAEFAAGRGEGVIRVGNLSAERDFTDVRDVVRAYRLIIAGEYAGEPLNVASGSAVSMRAVLDELIAASGLEVEVVVTPERLRAVDVPAIVGSAERLRSLTGWRPEHTIASTIRDVWLDATARASAGGA